MNQKRYWLWIGLIGVMLSCGAYYYLDNIGDSALINIPYLPAIVVSIVLFGLDGGSDGVAPFAIFIIYGFIVGSIIGWVCGKIKNRRQVGTTMN